KSAPVKLPPRPVEPKRTDFNKRGDIRGLRGSPVAPAGPSVPGTKFAPSKPSGVSKPTDAPAPAAKIALPADAKVISIKPPIVVRELAEQLKQKPFKIIA